MIRISASLDSGSQPQLQASPATHANTTLQKMGNGEVAITNWDIGPSPFLGTGVAIKGTGHHNIRKIIKLLERVQRRDTRMMKSLEEKRSW